MASIFTRTNEYVQPVKRNTFDLSFQNNLTMQFGKLYPVFVQEVLPGDSFKIKPTFALEFMPMVFPVQTRMRANLHFFYVRNRNLWKDFPDFIANTKDVQPPFLDMNGRYDDFLKIGGLGDYLGLPINLYGSYGDSVSESTVMQVFSSVFADVSGDFPEKSVFVTSKADMVKYIRENPGTLYRFNSSDNLVEGYNIMCFYTSITDQDVIASKYSQGLYFEFVLELSASLSGYYWETDSEYLKDDFLSFIVFRGRSSDPSGSVSDYRLTSWIGQDDKNSVVSAFVDKKNRQIRFTVFVTPSCMAEVSERFGSDVPLKIFAESFLVNPLPHTSTWTNPNAVEFGNASGSTFNSYLNMKLNVHYASSSVKELTPENSPYYDSVKNPNGIKISALVPRGIETIYNAFYRDIRNNPFMIDGQPEYNKYLETQEGGADTTPYKLHYRNWEQDFLTTAVQSPQQGAAPLVGISSNGQLKFQSEDGEVFTAQAKFADDGETLTGFTVESPNMPAGNLRVLVDMASSGISINDLRNVNSLQRWLENNMRKGLRLKDQIKAHFNVDIRYDELDMPEFIGGCSETIDVRMVTQTSADVEDSPLGSYAGQATCVGTSNHNISHYCDEHGFIIGIFSVAPVPNYSQLLPKHFIKRNVLDYFFPEFGHIGYQPIRYNEVCPVQTFNAGDSLEDTFGYQRAWYDYLARTDEVHGLFRSTLRNYLMNRTFNVKPQLSESFLLVDPKQLNDVFATNIVDEQTGEVKDDKILGQIYFDVKAKRPIPMFGIPRLE